MSDWFSFYNAIRKKDRFSVAKLLNDGSFNWQKDNLGITAKQWQEWVMPDASQETSSID